MSGIGEFMNSTSELESQRQTSTHEASAPLENKQQALETW